MTNIDFVPNDYIQKRESTRANIMYLVLFVLVMAGIGSTFSVIKLRQQSMNKQLAEIDAQILQAQEKMTLLEEFEAKGNEMIKAASMTADLYENAPRSVVLACLTNNLPKGVSLTEVKLYEKTVTSDQGVQTQYQKASAKAGQEAKIVQTHVEIVGIAPSDIGVAGFISKLANSVLFEGAALVESKELKVGNHKMREFKLAAVIKPELELEAEDVEGLYMKDALAMGTN